MLNHVASSVVVVLVDEVLAVGQPQGVAVAAAVPEAPPTSILDLCWRQLVRAWPAKARVKEKEMVDLRDLLRRTRHRYERCVSLRASVGMAA